jgi:hypothetical protein
VVAIARGCVSVIVGSQESSGFSSLGRLDAWYFLAPGAVASRRLDAVKETGVTVRQVGGAQGLGTVWAPARFKRVYAANGEKHVGYLRPHDVFRYLPDEVDRLSLTRTNNLDRYRLKRGMILQSCSGRNLGPSVVVDSHTAQFVLSHDMVRIEIDDERTRNYVAAFLQSRTGQGLLRRDKSGSVIDHITVDHVAAQEIPMLDAHIVDDVAEKVGDALGLIESARTGLTRMLRAYETALPQPARSSRSCDGWTISSQALKGRLDAARYDPWVADIRRQLLEHGGRPVSAVARVLKPPGRYKTIYVGRGHGLPFLSGSQILQFEVINQRHMASRTFKDPAAYELRKGWSVYQADGRAEEALGVPAMVPGDRDRWLASGHVGRLVPERGTNAGWLWLAASTWQVQAQLKSLASGSVVDSTFPRDMETVILPPRLNDDGNRVTRLWANFARARNLQREATGILDEALGTTSGIGEDELEGDELGLALDMRDEESDLEFVE